jgi:hypothetical protein
LQHLVRAMSTNPTYLRTAQDGAVEAVWAALREAAACPRPVSRT